ncbi:MAG: hypothetical protein LC808_02750 [Actinobacteria bacterium]|nr:hypothetical protein [Actinomycetota bacterium]
MAALAYVLLPISGMLAYFSWASSRVRFHGAQAVAVGLAWSVLLYAGSFLSAVLTQVVFVIGILVWLGLIITTALGRDVYLPFIGRACAQAVGLTLDDHSST